ncbi:MAG: hypothetical protein PVJ30_10110 [Thiohalocapsa sp.]
MTTREIAAALGVSHQGLAQLERSALAKIRRWLAARDLALEDLVRS